MLKVSKWIGFALFGILIYSAIALYGASGNLEAHLNSPDAEKLALGLKYLAEYNDANFTFWMVFMLNIFTETE